MNTPPHPVDRFFLRTKVGAWIVAFGLLLWTSWSAIPPDSIVALLMFGVVVLGSVAAMLTAFVVAIPLRIILNLSLKDRRRTHRAETILLSAVLAAVAGYVSEVWRERSRLVPPSGVSSLSQFARVAAPPRRLQLLQRNGDEYIVWTGESSGPFDLPSGPSCYLFDRNGELVDWQPETGEGGRVEEVLRSSSKTDEIGLDDALHFVSGKAP